MWRDLGRMPYKIGVIRPQAEEHLGLPEAERDKKEPFPCRFQGEKGLANTLIPDF